MQLQVKMPEDGGKITYFQSKKQQALSNIFRGFEVGRKVWLIFSRPKHNTKRLMQHFQSFKKKQ